MLWLMGIQAIPTTFQCQWDDFHLECNSICNMDFVRYGMCSAVFDRLNLHGDFATESKTESMIIYYFQYKYKQEKKNISTFITHHS